MNINNEIYYKSAIGADEVGTGEVFRPSVFVACYVPNNYLLMLENLGVKDSKKLTRKKCCEIATILMDTIPYTWYVMSNKRFNEVYQKIDNMNQIKAIAHNNKIKELYNKIKDNSNIDAIIIDKFCSEEKFTEYTKDDFMEKNATFVEKGEQAHLAVACASIIATYLEEVWLKGAEEKLQETIPGGNTKKCEEFAQKKFNEFGKDFLIEYSKINFSSIKKIIEDN